MKADLSRVTFNPLKHFTRVVMQQGRVQLDADWNEQAAILLHYLQVLAADVIGPHGGPDHGFEVTKATSGGSALANDFVIQSGRYYVDGVLCELAATPTTAVVDAPNTKVRVSGTFVDGGEFRVGQYVEVYPAGPPPAVPVVAKILDVDPVQRILTLNQPAPANPVLVRRAATYLTQPDLPAPPALESGKSYLVYLDVWERHLTSAEDDRIREVALGGPDTATRARTVWQVKVMPVDAPPACSETPKLLSALQPENRGRLRAMAKVVAPSTDACIIPPDSQYRGAENQLYRVEVHTGGPTWDGKTSLDTVTPATFKWSRENGSVIFPIVSGGGTRKVRLETLGRDDRFGLVENDWVEVQDDDSVLTGKAGALLQVDLIERATVTLKGSPDPKVGSDQTKHPLLRRWDLRNSKLQTANDGAALIVESADDWLVLEDGVQIQFAPPDAGAPANQYRTGDYWLIAARTATGDVEWPTEQGKDSAGNAVTVHVALPPAGVEHHYAPLAVVTVGATGELASRTPCRRTINEVAPAV
jgi:hypothetical protein